MAIPLSILDLAIIGPGQTATETFAGSVALAQRAEAAGYRRVWYAEHHNIGTIASSATAVLVAHVATQTKTIRLGAGGIMLPNHAPLIIAEQFGTLASLHPGRIDLGLGRAPGADGKTMRALRRNPAAAERFPEDVLELQAVLGDASLIPGITAIPGQGTHVPLYILGSSLFGAGLAAALGLPYAFASHFAPTHLHEAVALYRRQFKPSAQQPRPHVIAGLTAIVAESASDAAAQLDGAQRATVQALFGDGRTFTPDEADQVLASPAGQHVRQMMTYAAVGTPAEAGAYVEDFARHAGADEVIVCHRSPTIEARLRSVELLAAAVA
jgi:luciferase family oxidoreductase group 1